MFGFGSRKPKWGVVLSGGGVRGYAHLGALQALAEKGIKPDLISGVSAGAIAGVFIASGMSPLEAFAALSKYTFRDVTRFRLPRNGLLSLDNLGDRIKGAIDCSSFEELQIPLVVGVSNLLSGKIEYIDHGPIAPIIQASASIPVLFSPVKHNDQLYVDGGLFDNLPAVPLKGKCRKIIGINVSPVQEIRQVNGLIDIASRSFQLGVASGMKEGKSLCDIFIEPQGLENYDILNSDHAQEIFDLGYRHTMKIKC